ncbi:hypothetical protein I5677_00105 [Mobilitalea sibirica]|uniref:ABC-2 type transport system permease protein n=1 Tax=Mobilitalea sibirica TaxID=1462919 RepID=A0A8J7KZ37_9FIRM|nr:hypothetical protein [Mobilitalea sibirica]MBH1939288.1 hypothetical protein [Mobilitalea sibirica]
MKKVLRLISVQLGAILGDMLSIGNNRKRKPKAIYFGVLLFVLGMGSIAFFYCFMLGKGLQMYNSIDILPAMMMAVISMIVLLTTVFKVKGTIFGFKDYDMVMSLPVKTGSIVASRLILLYSINFLFVLMIMIPMMIAYGVLANPGYLFYLYGLLTIWFIPLVPIILASVLGTGITYIASKFRHSNLANIIVSVILILAIIVLPLFVKDTGEEIVNFSRALTEQVNSIYPLADMYTKAVVHNNSMALVSFLGISVVCFLLYSLLIGKVFKKMNTVIMTGRYRTNYKMGELKQTTPFQALYKKELARYFSSTIYVLNTGVGIIMLIAGAVALLFVDLEQMLGVPQALDMIRKVSPIFISFCLATSSTTMASISLEGKNLWVIKSLPVSTKVIFLSKMAVNFTITAPSVIAAVLISIVLELSMIQTLLLLGITIGFSFFVAVFGMLVNLKLPNFNWTTETVVVKQSASSVVTIFSGIGIAALQYLMLLILPSFELAYLIYGILLILTDIALYKILITWGNKRFVAL